MESAERRQQYPQSAGSRPHLFSSFSALAGPTAPPPARMASPTLRPGSTDRTPRTPPAPAPAPSSVPPSSSPSYMRKCVVLVDWWLERVEGKICIAGLTETPQIRKGGSSVGNRKAAARVFRGAIARRCDSATIETVNGYVIRIGRILNSSQMRENGFSEEVCESFVAGFPIKWKELADSNMENLDGYSQSPPKSADNAPSASVEFFLNKIMSDSFSSKGYAFADNNFNSFRRSTSNTDGPPTQKRSTSNKDGPPTQKRSTSNTDGPPTQKLSNLSNGNTGNNENSKSKAVASEELSNGRMDMAEGPLTPPGEIASNTRDDQHGSLQIDACEQEIVDGFVNSVSAKHGTGSIFSYSKVDGNRTTPSKIASVEKEGHMSKVGCDQEEQDAEVQHENMQSCLNEQEMRTPKCGKTSVNLGTGDVSEVPGEGMTPQFRAVRASEKDEVRKLRSGKVLGELSSAPLKSGNKQKRTQHKTSNDKKVPNEGVSPTADLTYKNGCSGAGIVTKDKQQSHDSPRKGRGRPTKRRSTNQSKAMFSSFL